MTTIKMPAAGKNASPGTVRRWRKKTGEVVHKGDILLEIETDAGVAEVESPVEGPLAQIIVQEGKTVAVNAAIAVIGDAGTAPSTNAKQAMTSTNDPKPSPTGKVVPILMPKAGQSMEEGTVVKWHVQPGATIAKGQVIFEIETDKATMDVEATDSGRLARIVIGEGQTIKVLEPVAYLAENDADVEALEGSGFRVQGSGKREGEAPAEPITTSATAARQEARPLSVPVSEGGRVKASPAARKFAEQRGIDLAAIGAGSGPGGRILSTDVPLAAERGKLGSGEVGKAEKLAVADGAVRKKMSQMRKAIARNLLLSKQTIPHFYIRVSINAEPLLRFYQTEKAKYPCSINDVIVAACAKGIREFPAFRSRIEGEEIVELPGVNIGVAIGMDDGLVVPVLVNADQLSLQQIGAATKRIAAAARAGKIEGMGQGVFTITNLGMFGVEEFSAIINPPEVAILAVGGAREEVIVSGGTLRPGKVMTLTLSADHRVIDGMLAAKFMARLKEMLEYPEQLV